ncbi:MAG: hypothetical protein IPL96_04060 [Holophagaceae bacterium]|nr:hypothetical protein [Holophagaceae bacterium]
MPNKNCVIAPAITLVLSILLGCAPPITLAAPPRVKNEHVVDKNYEVGKQISAFIGNPMVKVKDYVVIKNEAAAMESSQSFTLTGGPVRILVNQGDQLRIAGEIVKDGKRLTVLDVPQMNMQIMVDDAGRPYKDVINDPRGVRVVMVYDFVATPSDVVFTRKISESIQKTGGYQNYEILYSGKTDKSINLTYREYTPDDIARSAFSQNLTYEVDAKSIRFKNIQIELIAVTNEKIDFRVTSDQ